MRYFAIPILLLGLILGACSGNLRQSTLQSNYPAMYSNPPAAILIIPPDNRTTAVDAREYFSCSLSEAIGKMGYYVIPVEAVYDVLRDEGLYDHISLEPPVLKNLKDNFGADAILVSEITQWDKAWFLTSGSLTIGANFRLLSTQTGTQIWDYSSRIKVRLESSSEGFLGSVIDSALKTAIEDYFQHARSSNLKTFASGLPYGKYHPKFNTDMKKYVPPTRHLDITISK